MQRYIKEKGIERKAKLGKILTFGGLAVVVVIFIYSLQSDVLNNSFLIIVLIAMLLSQYGIFLDNRWGKHPRIDEVFDQALKGFDSKYSLFHYELGANHVLISPSGVHALIPVILEGEISYDDEKWYQTRIRRGKERTKKIKNLITDAAIEVRSLTKALKKRLEDQEIPEVKPILVLLHDDATSNASNAPIPIVHQKKLKSLIRKLGKGPTLDEGQVLQVADSLGF
jgi:hypothetical protein